MSDFTQPPPIKPPPVPAHAAGRPHQSKGMSKSMVIFLTSLLTFIATSICWILGIIMVKDIDLSGNPPFYVSTEAPEMVELGDQCVMVVTVSNEGEGTHTLSHIDIMDTLLDGFEVVSIRPKPTSKENIFGIYSYYSKHKLKPGEEATIKFTLKATETGDWSSTIDACDTMLDYVSDTVEIEVVEKGGIAKRATEEEAVEASDPDPDLVE